VNPAKKYVLRIASAPMALQDSCGEENLEEHRKSWISSRITQVVIEATEKSQ
jgi:hypothetical protein